MTPFQNPVALPDTTTNYILFSSNDHCNAQDTIRIEVNPYPTLVTSEDTTVCIGNFIEISAEGAQYYNWSTIDGIGLPNNSNHLVQVDSQKIYIVEGSNQYQCSVRDTIILQAFPQPNIQVKGPLGLCPGDTASIMVNGAVSYQWLDTLNIACNNCPNTIFYPDSSTFLIVESTDQFECHFTDSLVVDVWPLPQVIAGEDIVACLGEEVVISADTMGVSSFHWSPVSNLYNQNSLNPILEAEQDVSMYLLVTFSLQS